jgi:membrane protease YdiL (CAAX protease family)
MESVSSKQKELGQQATVQKNAKPRRESGGERHRFLPSTWLVLLYWGLGLLLGFLYLDPTLNLQSTFVYQGTAHGVAMAVGLASVILANVAYIQICGDQTSRPTPTLPMIATFSLGNGICETLWFLAVFQYGADLARKYTGDNVWIFFTGFMVLLTFCGAIHLLLWLQILPSHHDKKLSPVEKLYKRVWAICLFAMTMNWAWLYHFYQDFWSVTAMHTLTDIALVCVVRYSFYEPVKE